MGKCPLNKLEECVYEECQWFVDWEGNKQCAVWWMGVDALLKFDKLDEVHLTERKYQQLKIRAKEEDR